MFVGFMRSWAGRLLRIVAGAAIVVVGFVVVGGVAGTFVAAVGIIPVLAGVLNLCLLGPLMGVDLMGNRRAAR